MPSPTARPTRAPAARRCAARASTSPARRSPRRRPTAPSARPRISSAAPRKAARIAAARRDVMTAAMTAAARATAPTAVRARIAVVSPDVRTEVRVKAGAKVDVYRHDQITVDGIRDLHPTHVVISPGPKTPDEAGISLDVIREMAGEVPILGVCLGHQAIAEAYGATLLNLDQPFHGYQTNVNVIQPHRLFRQLPSFFQAGLYHSWLVDPNYVPDCLTVTAVSEEGHIMALHHREKNIHGVQFHPESYMTEHGVALMRNFLSGCRQRSL